MIRITVRGVDRIASGLRTPLGNSGFERAGAIVESNWKPRIHTVTRKAQGSIGHVVQGMSVRVGPRPGYGTPRRYTAAQASRWKRPRDGVNRGDPREYLVYEDQGTRYRPGHPAAEPALRESVDPVVRAIAEGIENDLRRNVR